MSNNARRRNKRSSAKRSASAQRRRRVAEARSKSEVKHTQAKVTPVTNVEQETSVSIVHETHAGTSETKGKSQKGNGDKPLTWFDLHAGNNVEQHDEANGSIVREHPGDASAGPDASYDAKPENTDDEAKRNGPDEDVFTDTAIDVTEHPDHAAADNDDAGGERDGVPEDEPEDADGESSASTYAEDESDDSVHNGYNGSDDETGEDESEIIIDDIDMGALKTLDHVVFWKVDDFINPVTGKPYGRLHLKNTPPKFVAKEHSPNGDTEVTMFVNAALAEKLAYLFRAMDRSFKGLPPEEDDGPKITTENWRQVIADYWHDNPLKVIGVAAAVIVIIAIVIAGWVIPK